MERIEKTVFISYRRTNFSWAVAIYQNLTHNGFDVFFDYTGIASGDFERVILGNVTARAHFLVLLTPSALERCGEPGDWLRREIETALEDRRNIVPLMLEEFDFGSPSVGGQLTGKLAALKSYNGLRIVPEYFFEAMDRLRKIYLNVRLTAVLHPASAIAKAAANEESIAANGAPPVPKEELIAYLWFERGFAATEPDEQIRCYNEAIRLKPDFAGGFTNRGIARYEKGDLDGAIQDSNEAIRLAPAYPTAFNNRGRTRHKRGDIEGAIADYSEAIRIDQMYAYAFNNRGMARDDTGDLDGAIQDYSEAIRLKPDFSIAFNGRGWARYNKGDLDGAMADYNEAIRFDQKNAEAFNNRGVARYARGDRDGAVADYNEAIRLSKGLSHPFVNRGKARYDAGDLLGAFRDYDEAIELGSDGPNALWYRAQAYEKASDLAAAVADLQTYLDLGGGHRNKNQEKVEHKIAELKEKIQSLANPS
jgi:tetratricopeptide (TPR) repeat protein